MASGGDGRGDEPWLTARDANETGAGGRGPRPDRPARPVRRSGGGGRPEGWRGQPPGDRGYGGDRDPGPGGGGADGGSREGAGAPAIQVRATVTAGLEGGGRRAGVRDTGRHPAAIDRAIRHEAAGSGGAGRVARVGLVKAGTGRRAVHRTERRNGTRVPRGPGLPQTPGTGRRTSGRTRWRPPTRAGFDRFGRSGAGQYRGGTGYGRDRPGRPQSREFQSREGFPTQGASPRFSDAQGSGGGRSRPIALTTTERRRALSRRVGRRRAVSRRAGRRPPRQRTRQATWSATSFRRRAVKPVGPAKARAGQREDRRGSPAARPPWPPQRPEPGSWPRPAPSLPAPDLLGPDEELVAGRRPVEEAFAAGRTAHRLVVVPQRRGALEQLVLHATRLRIPIVEVEGGSLTALAGFDGHQGVALVVDPRRYASPEEILARAAELVSRRSCSCSIPSKTRRTSGRFSGAPKRRAFTRHPPDTARRHDASRSEGLRRRGRASPALPRGRLGEHWPTCTPTASESRAPRPARP